MTCMNISNIRNINSSKSYINYFDSIKNEINRGCSCDPTFVLNRTRAIFIIKKYRCLPNLPTRIKAVVYGQHKL